MDHTREHGAVWVMGISGKVTRVCSVKVLGIVIYGVLGHMVGVLGHMVSALDDWEHDLYVEWLRL